MTAERTDEERFLFYLKHCQRVDGFLVTREVVNALIEYFERRCRSEGGIVVPEQWPPLRG